MRDLFFTIKFYSSNFFSRVRNFIIDAAKFTFYFTKAMFLFPFAKLGCVKAQLEIAEIVVSHNWQNYTKAIKKIIGEEVILGWIFTETLKNNIHALILAGDIYERKADDLHSSLRGENSKNTEDDVKNLFKISLNYYKQASDLGSAFAQLNCYRLHDFYHYCVDLTEAQAKEFLFLSAKNNLPNGQFLYGEEMLKQDRFEEGLFYIEKSVKAKKRMWAKEIGSYGNRKKATQWYKKNKNLKEIVQNAFSGNAQAMFEYSEYLLNDSHKNDSLNLLISGIQNLLVLDFLVPWPKKDILLFTIGFLELWKMLIIIFRKLLRLDIRKLIMELPNVIFMVGELNKIMKKQNIILKK